MMKLFKKQRPAENKDAEDAIDLLFVYGTLMQGLENAYFLKSPERVEYLGTARVAGRLYDVGEFPALIAEESSQVDSWVTGELYRMHDPESLLATLDVVEGVNDRYPERSLFVRRCIEAKYGEQRLRVWAYVYNQPVAALPQIPDGDYRNHLQQQAAVE